MRQSPTRQIIEYKVYHCNEDGDACDVETIAGKYWHSVRTLVSECEEDKHDEFHNGLRIGWIEKCYYYWYGDPSDSFNAQDIGCCGVDEVETLWERSSEEE
tara:strand:+ start:172 stop:474 length:303 start_codon:yes stop_codon:yes gene_type:complete